MSVVYLAPEIIGAMNEDQKTTFNKLRTWSMKVGRVLDIPSQTERSSRMIEKFLEQSDSLGDEVDSAGFEQEVSQALSGQIANLVKELSLVEPASSQGDEESKIDRVDLSTFEAVKYMQMLVPTVPSFDGDITKFGEFRSLFDRAVHNVPNLPDEIKYQVLRDKLVGDARNSLSSYKSDGSDYLALYSSLVAENSGKYRLARKTFADMTGIPPIRSPEVGQVEKFLAAARSWLRAMEEIDTENLAAFLMFEALFSRIDPSLAEKFNRVKTQELDSVPSAADLIQFLEGELSLIRMMPASSNPPNPGPHRYSSSKRPSGDVEPTRSANSFPNSSFKRFKSEPKPSRIAFVLQSKICINCFSFRYTLEGCPSERRCHCGERHHALVHQDPERPSGALKLPLESQQELKNQVLLALQMDQSDNMRRKSCEVAAEMARNLIDDDGNNIWPEFLQFLFQCANSSSPILKESALRMFSSVPGVFGNQQTQHLDLIKQMLHQSLMDQTSYTVRFQAVKAVSAFIMLHDKEDPIHKFFKDLLPPIMQVMAECVEKADDDTLLKCLIDLAESAPKFLRPQLDTIIQLCLKVMSSDDMDNSWKHLALEMIVTLSETAPAMMRKEAGKYIPVLVPLVLTLMTDLDDDPEWSVSDEIVEDDNDSNNVVAESALDRLACGLGGKTILPQVISNIPQMLSNPNWKYRHAALMAISAVGEGCTKQMEGMLGQIMEGVLQYLSDPHPRVRYAACNAIGQMSTDFAPTFEKKFHQKVIPGLLMVLEDDQNPRVQAHAGAALVNFSEDCPKPILVQYLNEIMAKLEAILSAKFNELVEKGTKLVLEQVVTTIASVADTSEEQFVAYYDRLIPCLKYIIQNANTPELKMLRGKTIECVSLIGLAVGKEKFIGDATEIMDLLLKTHTEGDLPDDDPQTSYLISAWARICKILGKQFQQYLPLVIGPVMRTASLKPEVTVMDNDDMDEVSGDDDWHFVSLGEQQNFGIRTAGIEDKASACDMLVCYARELKEGFADYAEPVVKLMVPMLKFYFHDGVRTAAAQSLPCLLECAKVKGSSFLQGMWEFICPELLKAIETEPEINVKHEHMYSLAKCIETLGKGCMTEDSLKELLRIVDAILKQHFERAVERLDKRKDEDYDEVVEEQLEDEDNDDNYTLGKVADIIHALFVTYKEDFYSYFDHIMGHFVKMMEPDQPWSDRQWGLCVFDDVIEFGGPSCIKYQQYFLRPIAEGVSDKNAAVRQAAAYGCGTLAMNGGPAFAGTCAEVLPRLAEMINDPESRLEENINSTENAISAVTKILQHNSASVNVDEILPHWLSWLPVWEDRDEAPHVYGYLCSLIETNNTVVLGPNSSNIPRLIAIIAESFHRGAICQKHPVAQRMISIIRQIQSSGEIFQLCVNQLTAEQQVALSELLNE